jgi:hypothetical protein
MQRVMIAALLTLTILPVAAALSWVTLAASPMSAAVAAPVTVVPPECPGGAAAREPLLPQSGMLMLVGSGLLGLAFILSTTTKT